MNWNGPFFFIFFLYCIWFHGWVSSAHWTADDGSWIRTRLLIELIRINWRLFSFHCYNLEYQQSSPDTQWVCALCVCFGRRFFSSSLDWRRILSATSNRLAEHYTGPTVLALGILICKLQSKFKSLMWKPHRSSFMYVCLVFASTCAVSVRCSQCPIHSIRIKFSTNLFPINITTVCYKHIFRLLWFYDIL